MSNAINEVSTQLEKNQNNLAKRIEEATFKLKASNRELKEEIESRTEGIPMGNERILFVDDEEALVNLGREVLERLGYEVTAGTSSIEAFETFRAQPNRYDLVITDQTMPKMTGAELAQKFLYIRPDIPIISAPVSVMLFRKRQRRQWVFVNLS